MLSTGTDSNFICIEVTSSLQHTSIHRFKERTLVLGSFLVVCSFLILTKIAGFGQGLQLRDEIINHFRSGKLVPFGETISFINLVYFADAMLHLAHNYTPVF